MNREFPFEGDGSERASAGNLRWEPDYPPGIETGSLSLNFFLAIENPTERSLYYLQALYGIFLKAFSANDLDELVFYRLNDLVEEPSRRFATHRFGNLRDKAEALIRWAGQFGETKPAHDASILGNLVIAARVMRPHRTDLRFLPLPEEIGFDFSVTHGRQETNPRVFDSLDTSMRQVVIVVAQAFDYEELDRQLLFRFSLRLEEIVPQHANMDHHEVVATLFQWLLDADNQRQAGVPSWQDVIIHLQQQRPRNANFSVIARQLGLQQPVVADVQSAPAAYTERITDHLEETTMQEASTGNAAPAREPIGGAEHQEGRQLAESELRQQSLEHLYRQLMETEGRLGSLYDSVLTPHTFSGGTLLNRNSERAQHSSFVASQLLEVSKLLEQRALLESILRDRFEKEIVIPVIAAVKDHVSSHPSDLSISSALIFDNEQNRELGRLLSRAFPLFQVWFRAFIAGKKLLKNSETKALNASNSESDRRMTIVRASILGSLYQSIGAEIAQMSWTKAGIRYQQLGDKPPFSISGQAAPVADLLSYQQFIIHMDNDVQTLAAKLQPAKEDPKEYNRFAVPEQHAFAQPLTEAVENLRHKLEMEVVAGTSQLIDQYHPAFYTFDYSDVARLSSASLNELKRYTQSLLEKVEAALREEGGNDLLVQALEGMLQTIRQNLETIDAAELRAQKREAIKASNQSVEATIQARVGEIMREGAVDRLRWGRVNESDRNAHEVLDGESIAIEWPRDYLPNTLRTLLLRSLLPLFRDTAALSDVGLTYEQIKPKIIEFFRLRGVTLFTGDSDQGPDVIYQLLERPDNPIKVFFLVEFVFSLFTEDQFAQRTRARIGDEGVKCIVDLRESLQKTVEMAIRKHLTEKMKRTNG